MSEYSIALEKQLEMHRFFGAGVGAEIVGKVFKENRDGDLQVVDAKTKRVIADGRSGLQRLALETLNHGNPYYWNESLSDLVAFAAKDMPDWTMTEDALPDRGLFWFAKPLPAIINSGGAAQAISWMRSYDPELARSAFSFIYWIAIDRPVERAQLHGLPIPITRTLWPFDLARETVLAQVADEDRRARIRELMSFVAAATELLSQTLVAPRRDVSRATTRRVDRMGWQHEAAVNVVLLRRYRQTHRQGDGQSEPQDWSCQWMVRGHWRNQWYPRLNRHQPKWITPYVSGKSALKPEGFVPRP